MEANGLKKNTTKKYMNCEELFGAALKAARADSSWRSTEETVCPEYLHSCSTSNKEILHLCNFDVISRVRYGSNEGIIGRIYIEGRYHHDHKGLVTCDIGLIKTLLRERDAYIALHTLCGLICYYANEYIRHNLDRFD